MKFLFYKVASLIGKKLNIQYNGTKFNETGYDERFNFASKYSLLYISLFICPKDSNGELMEIDEENIKYFVEGLEDKKSVKGIGGRKNSKSYVSGIQSIPSKYSCKYEFLVNDRKCEFSPELIRVRYNFFKSLIVTHDITKISETLQLLKYMVNNSCNVSSDLKTKICDIKQEDIFYKTFATEFSSGKDLEYIEIFKILAYSVNFSEERSVYDDLESNVEVLPEYIERKNITDELSQAFERSKVVYLCGIRGSGKTEISKKFISENNFFGVITLSWLESIDEVLKHENIFKLENEKNKTNFDAFHEMSKDYLLVVENVTFALTKEWKNFIDSCGCKVLVISSWKPREDGLTVVDVNNLTKNQAIALMDRYLETNNKFAENQKAIITKKLNYHALAITVYSKAIAQSCLDYDKIISILDENLVSSEIEECVSFKQEEKLACEHIRTLFMQTLNNQLTDDDKTVLRVMSLMPDFGISLNQLQKYTGLTNNNPIYCKLKPLCWLNIDISKVVTIHSIIRDIVLEELKPDTENCSILISHIYNDIQEHWNYSLEGIEYRKIYFSVWKKISLNYASNHKEVFNLMFEGISSFVNYGYNHEAKKIYNKIFRFIEPLPIEEQIAFRYRLNTFCMKFIDPKNLNDYRDILIKLHKDLIETLDDIYSNNNYNVATKRQMCSPYISLLIEHLILHIDSLCYSKENIQESNYNPYRIEELFYELYNVIRNFYPRFNLPYIGKSSNFDIVIPKNVEPEYYEFMVHFTHIRLIYITNYLRYDSVCRLFKQFNNIFKDFYGELSSHYLKYVYSYYCSVKKFFPTSPIISELEEEIKEIYNNGNFYNYNLEYVFEIVKELNLSHSGIISLEANEE